MFTIRKILITRFIIPFLYIDFLFYIRNFFVLFLVDSIVLDDEPLWEPFEWSVLHTWLLFIGIFSWAAEVMMATRLGSFTGRDKRLYLGLYKSYWWMELLFMVTLFLACTFVIFPFYAERSQASAYLVTWWHWYNRNYFFKLAFLVYIINIWNNTLILVIRWLNWKIVFFYFFLVFLLLSYQMFWLFFNSFFFYFGDISWYNKQGWSDYSSLTHNSGRWGWGDKGRDPFFNHSVTLSFWYKNDGLMAGAFLFLNIFTLMSFVFVNIQWFITLQAIYTTKEVSYTLLTLSLSYIKQLMNFFMLTYFTSAMFFIYKFMKLPYDYHYFWSKNDSIFTFVKSISDLILLNFN